ARTSKSRLFQSTRPAWGATGERHGRQRRDCVSIHAPRVGRDAVDEIIRTYGVVSIHAPRVGRDSERTQEQAPVLMFQSTRPAWGATADSLNLCHACG
ncbi:MAG: hypothetical protein WBP85_06140, partial [Terracidiphilus sp.]